MSPQEKRIYKFIIKQIEIGKNPSLSDIAKSESDPITGDISRQRAKVVVDKLISEKYLKRTKPKLVKGSREI